MAYRVVFLIVFFLAANSSVAEDGASISEEQAYQDWEKTVLDSLNRQTGQIILQSANVTLHIPEDFYYLSPEDSDTVLVNVWGNPPGARVLGMLFRAPMTPFDPNAWAVTIEYEEDGYVSDADAGEIDYHKLLLDMQRDTKEASEQRVSQGYESIELIGWASEPFYDETENKLHWAKEIRFGDDPVNTLNYNIRVLGRKGVLVLNFIAGMDQKAMIDGELDTVLELAKFNPGGTYQDFNPDVDKVAAYGLGALVAGKVAAKTGLLAAALVFLKKFGVVIFIAIAGLFRTLFRRRSKG